MWMKTQLIDGPGGGTRVARADKDCSGAGDAALADEHEGSAGAAMLHQGAAPAVPPFL